MATPTKFEIESAESRATLAEDMNSELSHAKLQLGDDASAYGVWVITDRVDGSIKRYFCAQWPGRQGWQPPAPEQSSQERLTAQHHPGYDFNGQTVYPFRYVIAWGSLLEYRPLSAEKVADQRAKRNQKKITNLEREQSEMLFPELLDEQIESLRPLTL